MNLVEKELEQSISTLRTQMTLTVNMLTIILIADVTLVGFSVESKSAGVLLIGALFPLVMFLLFKIVKRLMVPVLFTAISLEQKYGDKNDNYLATTFSSFLSNENLINALKKIDDEKDMNVRMRLLKKYSTFFHWTPNGIISKLLLVVFLGQIIVPLFLFYFQDWKFF